MRLASESVDAENRGPSPVWVHTTQSMEGPSRRKIGGGRNSQQLLLACGKMPVFSCPSTGVHNTSSPSSQATGLRLE